MDRLFISEKDASFEVTAYVDRVGDDLLVLLSGGKAHVGAVGIAQARPSLSDPSQTSSTGSVITLPGHKEDTIAKHLAERLSAKLGCGVVVVAGMHWEGLSQEGSERVLLLCARIGERIVEGLKGGIDG